MHILSAVPVTNGLFTVQLNTNGEFGTNAFNGESRWLQIGVRTNSTNNAFNNFTFLAPRQPLDATPQAMFALNASNAVNASVAANVADGAITSSKLADGSVGAQQLAPGVLSWLSLADIPAGFADGVDNGSSYTAGEGLNLSLLYQFSVDFGGSGSATSAARSDHDHFGASWGGNVSLANGLSVTNGANNSVGLYGQQGTGSGFPYIFGNTAGVWGESSQGSGVWGASATFVGVSGVSLGQDGYGVRGAALATNGITSGVYGQSASVSGTGVRGHATASSGTTSGVRGESDSSNGAGVLGVVLATNGTAIGVAGQSFATEGIGVFGLASSSVGKNTGVSGWSSSLAGTGVYGKVGNAALNSDRQFWDSGGVVGDTSVSIGVIGLSDYGEGVFGSSHSKSGVQGHSINASGVTGVSENSFGVSAQTKNGVGIQIVSEGGNLVEAYNNGNVNSGRKFRITGAGDVYAAGSFNPNGADFAEMLPAQDSLEPGDVLVIGKDGKLARSTQPYEANVAGVHATKPGLLGGAHEGADLTGKIPLAVVGVVPVKVTDENGLIEPGDKLTSSSTPGHAMKADDHAKIGTVIGKALEGFSGQQGVIQILVILQ